MCFRLCLKNAYIIQCLQIISCRSLLHTLYNISADVSVNNFSILTCLYHSLKKGTIASKKKTFTELASQWVYCFTCYLVETTCPRSPADMGTRSRTTCLLHIVQNAVQYASRKAHLKFMKYLTNVLFTFN